MRISDWSSDVCSSELPIASPSSPYRSRPTMLDPNPSVADLDALLDRHRNDDAAMEKIVRGYLRCAIYSYQAQSAPSCDFGQVGERFGNVACGIDRKSVVLGKGVSVRVDIGGWRNIKKKKEMQHNK